MDNELIKKIQNLRNNGDSYGEIARKLLITKSQACYFSKIDLEKRNKILENKLSFEEKVCDLAKRCKNINQICSIIGKKATNENYRKIEKIIIHNNIDISHFEHINTNGVKIKKDIEYYLVSGSTISIPQLRERIIRAKIKEHRCEKCKRTEWEGEPIPLQLHHINGDRRDNRLTNLQLLCPNCHALTDNYCGKKLKVDVNKCKICGKEISRNAKYCRECFNKNKKNKYKEYKNGLKHPSKEELINDFCNLHSFSSVGKKYGVSDKAVVKWCESYLLPNTKQEIKKYLRDIGKV